MGIHISLPDIKTWSRTDRGYITLEHSRWVKKVRPDHLTLSYHGMIGMHLEGERNSPLE